MERTIPNLVRRVQKVQTQLHKRHIALLQTRSSQVFGIRATGCEDRARLWAFQAADQRHELLDTVGVICLEVRVGLYDVVGDVNDGNLHGLDLLLERIVHAVCWNGCGESGAGEGESGGEVNELHIGDLLLGCC